MDSHLSSWNFHQHVLIEPIHILLSIMYTSPPSLIEQPNKDIWSLYLKYIVNWYSKIHCVKLSCDAYKLSLLLYSHRLTGCSPFLGDSDSETFQNVLTGDFEFPEEDPSEGYTDVSDHAKEFISSFLMLNPRYSATSTHNILLWYHGYHKRGNFLSNFFQVLHFVVFNLNPRTCTCI